MKRKYYTLLERDSKSEPWGVEFGSYRRSEAAGERCPERAKHSRIICTGDQQWEIDAEVRRLNAVEEIRETEATISAIEGGDGWK